MSEIGKQVLSSPSLSKLLTSKSVIGPGVPSTHAGELSLISSIDTATDTVLMPLRGVVPVVTRKAYKVQSKIVMLANGIKRLKHPDIRHGTG